jgi:hypothetical protein
MALLTLYPTGNTYIDEDLPTTAFGANQTFLVVGQFSGIGDDYRSILKFNVDKIPFDYSINSATLSLFITRNDVPSLSKTISFFNIIKSFDINTVTYNTMPSISSVPSATTNITNQLSTRITVDVTSMVTNWHTGSADNNGIMIIGNETTDSLIAFIGTGYGNINFWPILTINTTLGTIIEYPSQVVTTSDTLSGSNAISIGTSMGTFAITNNGSNSASVFPELSPDGVVWINDLSPVMTTPTLNPGESIVLTTRGHMNFARIAFQSVNSGQSTQLTIYATTINTTMPIITD